MLRCIHYSNFDGSIEGVFFTDDFSMDAADCIPPNCSLDNEFKLEKSDFPNTFPFDYNLEVKR